MFFVHGVNISNAREAAKKKVEKEQNSDDSKHKLSQAEYEMKIEQLTKKKLLTMKPKRLSGPLSTPKICNEFIELANAQGQYFNLEIKHKVPTGAINPKTRKPEMRMESYFGEPT